MLSPYLKFFDGSDLGSKSNKFAIPELECSWVAIFFAACSLSSKKYLHTEFMAYIYKYRLLIKF